MSAWGRGKGVVSTGQLENAADMHSLDITTATKKAAKSRKAAKRRKLGKKTREQHEEASALLGSAGLEATEPVRKQHSRGFVLPG